MGGYTTFDCYENVLGSPTFFNNEITSITVVNTEVLTTVFMGKNMLFTNADTSSNKWTLGLPLPNAMLPTATGTNVVADLGPVNSNSPVPACANAMATSCPSLYSVVLNSSNAFEANYFICHGVLNASCPGLCTDGRESVEWINWVFSSCAGFSFFNKKLWLGYPKLESAAYDSLLPWSWRIQSTDPSYPCPSNGQKLISFAVINILMSICNLILGRRDVVNWLTYNKWGQKDSYPYFWVFSSLVTVSLALLANFINALLVKKAPGFENVPLGALALFWFTRPRLAWMATALVRIQQDDQIYTSLAASSLAAEIILQALGSIYIGTTAAYGIHNGFFNAGRLKNIIHGIDAQVMYVGALIWLASVWLFYARVIWIYTGIATILRAVCRKVILILGILCCAISTCCCWVLCCCGYRESCLKPDWDFHDFFDDIGPDESLGFGAKLEALTGVFMYMFIPYAGQWLFWVGFIGLAGNQLVAPFFRVE